MFIEHMEKFTLYIFIALLYYKIYGEFLYIFKEIYVHYGEQPMKM